MTIHVPFNNSYARLPDRFFARVEPSSAQTPRLIRVNRHLALDLNLDPDWLQSPEGIALLTGKVIAPGSEPIATAYAGHQFGNFVPQLGDGRAILLGEVVDKSGKRRDLQLKGSGRTPFSRGGDGKAALGPVMREYIVSEAMAAMGIPTTRALSAATTGEMVVRETFLPGAILARVASSHIRVGTFQFFAARGDKDGIRLLADHVIDRHYPEAAEAEKPYRTLLDSVIAAQANLIARWLLVGFIHGVMNTDNMSVAGETIDYGPCAFLDAYDPAAVFSSIDAHGRYAYANQPKIGLWNLTRFAETLIPLLNENQDAAVAEAEEALSAFPPLFQVAYERGIREKLGLSSEREGDAALSRGILDLLAQNQVDFTLFFRRLANDQEEGRPNTDIRDLFIDPTTYDRWASGMARTSCARSAERRSAQNHDGRRQPGLYPRNHRIEAAIQAAVAREDFAPFHELVHLLSRPFDDQPAFSHYAEPPQEDERVLETFCGT